MGRKICSKCMESSPASYRHCPACGAELSGAVEGVVSVNVPDLGESVSEAKIAAWHKREGDFVSRGELLGEVETDKITVEVSAPVAGRLTRVRFEVEDEVVPGDVLAQIDPRGRRSPMPEPANQTDEDSDSDDSDWW